MVSMKEGSFVLYEGSFVNYYLQFSDLNTTIQIYSMFAFSLRPIHFGCTGLRVVSCKRQHPPLYWSRIKSPKNYPVLLFSERTVEAAQPPEWWAKHPQNLWPAVDSQDRHKGIAR